MKILSPSTTFLMTEAGPRRSRRSHAASGTVAWLRRRRVGQAGQSAIISIIVLFLLLFLGAIFIALIANNLRSTQRAANVSAAGRYAEAGINYLDQQLTNAAEGADWRPVPECSAAPAMCALSTSDPDYFWLQPYRYDTVRQQWIGGFTRINFGGPTPGSVGPSGTSGGRALVRVTYRPDITGSTTNPTSGEAVQPINKYIKLEVVGRVGQIVANDPTTYQNTEGLGLRVEQIAYKAIGINEYALQATNKDNKPVTATLGAPAPVLDRGKRRDIETIIEGPVRFNTNLTFYGVNRFLLDPTRNDSIEVAGTINLSGVTPTTTSLTATDPTRVYVNTVPGTSDTPNLLPSQSNNFTTTFPSAPGSATTVPGLVRDNPRGAETQGLTQVDTANRNLRTVSRTSPPLLDAAIGPNGLTRYRALTRDSAPLAPQFVAANDINDPTNGLGPYAGQYGWGQGLYLANTSMVQNESESLVGGYSLRSDWLNPDPTRSSSWQGDYKYDPPAVTIILTPRYMILRRSDSNLTGTRAFAFRQPSKTTTGPVLTAGQRLGYSEILRYTDSTNLKTTDPFPNRNAPMARFSNDSPQSNYARFEGYPATLVDPANKVYKGDFVIYAEGNIRIRGVVGGLDPETQAFFERHLTVVSGNGNIYIDGNLLRDNIPGDPTDPIASSVGGQAVKGRSSIALLAKNSIVVNTTQFLSPGDATPNFEEDDNQQTPSTRLLNPSQPKVSFNLAFGPEDANNTIPAYLSGTSSNSIANAMSPSLFIRQGLFGGSGTVVYANMELNQSPPTALPNGTLPENFNRLDLGVYGDAPTDPTLLVMQTASVDPNRNQTTTPSFFDHVFSLPRTDIFGAGTQIYPFTRPIVDPPATLIPLVGTDNVLRLEYLQSTYLGSSSQNYKATRVGVAPLDIRVEALMYAQEGTFFIIPGPWFNPDPNDTFERFVSGEPTLDPAATSIPPGRRAGENATTGVPRINHLWPFYKEPQDVRMTFFGAITENLPAEIGDQGAWTEKWGWVPDEYGSTGLTGDPNYPVPPTKVQTVHGRYGYLRYPTDSKLGKADPNALDTTVARGGAGIIYQFDDRAISPYVKVTGTNNYTPVRPNPYFADQPLPLTPRLPVAPGLLYYGQATDLPR